MTEEIYVPCAIRSAVPGTLLHIITEKIAYGLHEKFPEQNQDTNWFTAQQYFENWLTGRFGEYIFPLTGLLENMIDHGKKSCEEQGRQIEDIHYYLGRIIIDVNENYKPIKPFSSLLV